MQPLTPECSASCASCTTSFTAEKSSALLRQLFAMGGGTPETHAVCDARTRGTRTDTLADGRRPRLSVGLVVGRPGAAARSTGTGRTTPGDPARGEVSAGSGAAGSAAAGGRAPWRSCRGRRCVRGHQHAATRMPTRTQPRYCGTAARSLAAEVGGEVPCGETEVGPEIRARGIEPPGTAGS